MAFVLDLVNLTGNSVFDVVELDPNSITITSTDARLGESITITTTDTDLTSAVSITATYNGVSLSGQANVTANTVDFDIPNAGLKLGDNYTLELNVDGLVGQVGKDLLAPTGFDFVTLTATPDDPPLATYAGNGANLIGVGDQVVYSTATNGTFFIDGILSFTGGSSGDQTIDWFYLDAQDSFARSATQTFTLLAPAAITITNLTNFIPGQTASLTVSNAPDLTGVVSVDVTYNGVSQSGVTVTSATTVDFTVSLSGFQIGANYDLILDITE